MIWWFLILGGSTLVVVCVAIALYMHLRHTCKRRTPRTTEPRRKSKHQRQPDSIEH